jgi:hypothetical protein
MFETAVLANQSDTKRVWSTCAGMTAQTLLVLGAFLAPAIWPEVLPHAQMPQRRARRRIGRRRSQLRLTRACW